MLLSSSLSVPRVGLIDISETNAYIECLEHNHDHSKNSNFGNFDKMDVQGVLQHNLAGAQSSYVQCTS